MMNLAKYYSKAFIGGYWMVGLKDKFSGSITYKKVPVPKGQWIADPFLYEYNGRHYLFVEQYFNSKNRAGIGVYEIVDGKPVHNTIVIENPYHMSYPCVFSYNGAHYMIPESSSNQTLDLYMSEDFPTKLKLKKTLINGRRLVDTTVVVREDGVFLLTYENKSNGWILYSYCLDMDDYSLSKIGETYYKTNIGRPAGHIFEQDGRLFRPAQNCSTKYGESILLYEVNEFSKDTYREKFAYEIKCSDIKFEEHFERMHTLNTDSRFEVIDVFQEHFDFFHWWKIFKRKFLKK